MQQNCICGDAACCIQQGHGQRNPIRAADDPADEVSAHPAIKNGIYHFNAIHCSRQAHSTQMGVDFSRHLRGISFEVSKSVCQRIIGQDFTDPVCRRAAAGI